MIELLIEARDRLSVEIDQEAINLVSDIDLYLMKGDVFLIEASNYLN